MTKEEIIIKFNKNPNETIAWLCTSKDMVALAFAAEDLGVVNHCLITVFLIQMLNHKDAIVREGALRGIDIHLGIFDELDPTHDLLITAVSHVKETDLSITIRSIAKDTLNIS